MADSWAAVPIGKEPKLTLPDNKVQPIPKDGSWPATPLKLEPFKLSPKNSSDVENQPGYEGVGKTGIRLVNKGLPIIGGVLGAFGGPGGSMAGAGAGSVAAANIERYLNEGSDAKALTPGEQAITFGKNAALTGIGGKIAGLAAEAFPGPIQSRLAATLANTVFNQGARGAENVVGQTPEAPSPGTFGKDFATNTALDLVLGKLISSGVKRTEAGRSELPTETTLPAGVNELRSRLQVGEGPLPQNASETRARSTSEHGTGAQIVLKGNLETAKAVEKAAYKRFEDTHRDNNVIQIPQVKGYEPSVTAPMLNPDGSRADVGGKPVVTPRKPIIEQTDIRGPIYTTDSTLKAARFKPTIDAFVKGPEFQSLPPFQQARFKQLSEMVDKLLAGTPTIGKDGQETKLPILEYDTAKEIKTIISQTVGGKSNKTLSEGGLTELAKSLDKDIDTSVSTMWKDGKKAQSDLDIAHDASSFKNTVFDAELKKRAIYGKDDKGRVDIRKSADPEQVFKTAYKTQEGATKLLQQLGPENHAFIKGDYFDNKLLPLAFGKGQEKFNPRAIIDEFSNPNSPSRVILSANERNSISQFMKAAESSSPESSVNGLKIKDRIASIVIGQVAGGATGIPGVRQTVNIGTQQLLKAMLENPKIAEYSTRLVKTPSTSTQGQQLTKLLMRGLRGSEVTMVTDEGEKKGTITENGMVKFN